MDPTDLTDLTDRPGRRRESIGPRGRPIALEEFAGPKGRHHRSPGQRPGW